MKKRVFAVLLSMFLLVALLPIGAAEAVWSIRYDAATDALTWSSAEAPHHYSIDAYWGEREMTILNNLPGDSTTVQNFSQALFAYGFYGDVKITVWERTEGGGGSGLTTTIHVDAPADAVILPAPVCTLTCDRVLHWDAIPNASRYLYIMDCANGMTIMGGVPGTMETPSMSLSYNGTISIYAEANTAPYLSSAFTTVVVDDVTIHPVTNYVTVTAATCTTDGSEQGTCPLCSKTITRTIPALGHTPAAYADVAPTCTKAGQTGGTYCSVCSEQLTAPTAVPPRGHNYVEVVLLSATCTMNGTKGFVCSRCGDILSTTTIPALGHASVAYADIAPTCTEAGRTGGTYCSVCGVQLTAPTVVSALGHTEAEYLDVAPTCTEAGQTGGTYCSVCNEQLTAPTVVAALGHDPTYVSNGDCTHTVTCSRCDEVLEANAPCTPVDHVCTLCGGYVFLKGDVNLDTAVTAQDAAALMRYIVGLDALSEIKLLAANVDGGSLTSSDAACILRYVVNSAW